MERSIPVGFSRCEVCGEFNGTTQARYLNWVPDPPESYGDVPISAGQQAVVQDLKHEVAATMDPDEEITVRCLCQGRLCRQLSRIRWSATTVERQLEKSRPRPHIEGVHQEWSNCSRQPAYPGKVVRRQADAAVLATKREVDMTQETLVRTTAEDAEDIAQLTLAAERGDGEAACELGDRYREGRTGVRHSPKNAFLWYARSALAGDPRGQNNVGACFQHGIGCVQSYARALNWYRRSAAQGEAIGSSNVGYCYLCGHGVPVDIAVATDWFRKALEQGDEGAADVVRQLGG